MGGHTYYVKPDTKPAFDALMLHPNFSLSEPPKGGISNRSDLSTIIDYVIESVAHFVSPPKHETEHDELACDDVANEIRTNLRDKIHKKLKDVGVSQSGWTKITESVKSLPPRKQWILVASLREGGVVYEAVFEGLSEKGSLEFRLRGGTTLFEDRAVAWSHKPAFPKV